ncbi:NYN domain-containing protein [Nocardioides sp.]|uniref:NYN domain-containing protein n=1 Tax=Nocardioides sp. TaxID=35761 RepID=UPI003513EB95
MTDPRIAVLIDADNVSHRYAGPLLEELAKFGRTTVKRAYGDWSADAMKGWRSKLNRHAISPSQAFAYTTGKNSTDSALIIDAMDLLYSGNVDAFAIVSSDSDFTRLVTRLRESGRTVYGVGRRSTARPLQEACDQFLQLELLDVGTEHAAAPADEAAEAARDASAAERSEQAGPADAAGTAEPVETPNLQSLLTRAVNNAAGDDGWAGLGPLGSNIRRLYSAFDAKEWGHRTLLTLVQDQPYLVTEGSGSAVRVGVKGQVAAPPSKATATKPARTAAKKTASKNAKKAPAAKAAADAGQAAPASGATATAKATGAAKATVTTRRRSSRSGASAASD